VLFLVTILLPGCSDQKSDASASINENASITKLAQILKQPSDYVDKAIVVNGNYFTPCSASCCANEFVLKDGINQIKVICAKDLKLPKIKSAQPIKLSGVLKTTAESPYIQANAIEVR
jgi:uncharacterized protein YdeI (BOF family)